ncbi:TraI domain-containing protein [Photobacterium sp. ZSDE20]|uniref:TraI domain-containing protein n=1 Tax=Photobacterium pectinilyticum TaxID=2906793 RepID=A0ABT1N128_9GAMM|nr:TraI domain-containing protein [Photobacterium sp. ZSDE20]MCQ1058405.1 TraI domain-containing protein [Photobacterium sp. ZSDE20]MDD1825232.1 TraI domain-containing protein [Photobacterium sp. ZSDE20]
MNQSTAIADQETNLEPQQQILASREDIQLLSAGHHEQTIEREGLLPIGSIHILSEQRFEEFFNNLFLIAGFPDAKNVEAIKTEIQKARANGKKVSNLSLASLYQKLYPGIVTPTKHTINGKGPGKFKQLLSAVRLIFQAEKEQSGGGTGGNVELESWRHEFPHHSVDWHKIHFKPQREQFVDVTSEEEKNERYNFDTLFRQVIIRFTDLIGQTPASESHHHNWPGGLLQHSLEVASISYNYVKAQDLKARAFNDIEVRRKNRWQYGAWVCGLLHDIGKIITDMRIVGEDAKGELFIWKPLSASLTEFCRQHKIDRYYIDMLDAQKSLDHSGRFKRHENVAVMLWNKVLTPEAIDYLSTSPDEGNGLLEQISNYLSGKPCDPYLSTAVRKGEQNSVHNSFIKVRSSYHLNADRRDNVCDIIMRILNDKCRQKEVLDNCFMVGGILFARYPETLNLVKGIIAREQPQSKTVFAYEPQELLQRLTDTAYVKRASDTRTLLRIKKLEPKKVKSKKEQPSLVPSDTPITVFMLSHPSNIFGNSNPPKSIPAMIELSAAHRVTFINETEYEEVIDTDLLDEHRPDPQPKPQPKASTILATSGVITRTQKTEQQKETQDDNAGDNQTSDNRTTDTNTVNQTQQPASKPVTSGQTPSAQPASTQKASNSGKLVDHVTQKPDSQTDIKDNHAIAQSDNIAAPTEGASESQSAQQARNYTGEHHRTVEEHRGAVTSTAQSPTVEQQGANESTQTSKPNTTPKTRINPVVQPEQQAAPCVNSMLGIPTQREFDISDLDTPAVIIDDSGEDPQLPEQLLRLIELLENADALGAVCENSRVKPSLLQRVFAKDHGLNFTNLKTSGILRDDSTARQIIIHPQHMPHLRSALAFQQDDEQQSEVTDTDKSPIDAPTAGESNPSHEADMAEMMSNTPDLKDEIDANTAMSDLEEYSTLVAHDSTPDAPLQAVPELHDESKSTDMSAAIGANTDSEDNDSPKQFLLEHMSKEELAGGYIKIATLQKPALVSAGITRQLLVEEGILSDKNQGRKIFLTDKPTAKTAIKSDSVRASEEKQSVTSPTPNHKPKARRRDVPILKQHKQIEVEYGLATAVPPIQALLKLDVSTEEFRSIKATLKTFYQDRTWQKAIFRAGQFTSSTGDLVIGEEAFNRASADQAIPNFYQHLITLISGDTEILTLQFKEIDREG